MRRVVLSAALCALLLPLAAAAAPSQAIITVPANMTVEAQSFAGATVTYTASAVDEGGNPLPVECNPPSGSVFGFGRTRVTCTARDGNQTSTKRFDITVVDTTPPAITVQAQRRVSTTSRSGRVVAYPASASDLVDGPVAVTCSPASGTHFPVGTTSGICTAGDARGNVSSTGFSVTVVFVTRRAARSAAMLSPRFGATVRRAPMLRWRAAPKATFYNVQLFRRGHKVLTVWPSRARFRLHAQWTFRGDRYRLRPGNYSWLVWPAYGTLSKPRYGKLLGQSSFTVAKRNS